MRAKLEAVHWPLQEGTPSGQNGEVLLGDAYEPCSEALLSPQKNLQTLQCAGQYGRVGLELQSSDMSHIPNSW